MEIKLKEKQFKKSGIFCGIDQGISGAIAFLNTNKKNNLIVHDMPTLWISSGRKSKKTGKMGKKRILDFGSLKNLLILNHPDFTVVEKPVISLQGREGRTSLATTHMNAGIIIGMIFMAEFSYTEMRPMDWQKLFFKSKKGNTKSLSYDIACKLFPKQCNLFIGDRGGIKDGRTDAALMAITAQRLFYGDII